MFLGQTVRQEDMESELLSSVGVTSLLRYPCCKNDKVSALSKAQAHVIGRQT